MPLRSEFGKLFFKVESSEFLLKCVGKNLGTLKESLFDLENWDLRDICLRESYWVEGALTCATENWPQVWRPLNLGKNSLELIRVFKNLGPRLL